MSDDPYRFLFGQMFGEEPRREVKTNSARSVKAARKSWESLKPLFAAAEAHPEIAQDIYVRCVTVALACASHLRDAATYAEKERIADVDGPTRVRSRRKARVEGDE